MPEQSLAATSKPAGIEAGLVVGGRFEVIERVVEDTIGELWSARDQQTNRPIALRVLKRGLLPQSATADFREACRTAASLSHRNIVRLFGIGHTPNRQHFIAGEWAEGSALSEFIEERRNNGKPISLRGTYNVVAHICSALTYAHQKTTHGTLRPSAVTVTRGGRVKVRDFGVGQVLLKAVGPRAFKDADHACLAPEVKDGGGSTIRSDVFGVGAILYALLTTRSPADDFLPPSQARDDVPPEVDEILLRCLAQDPLNRFESPDAIRTALLPHLTQANSMSPPAHSGMEVEIDLGSVLPPADAEISEVKVPPPPPKPQLGELLEKLSADTGQRWMVYREKMDHGPFSARELIERLNVGDFSGDNHTSNIETGERKALREWPEFREFILQREHQNAIVAEREARENATKSEKRSAFAKWMFAAGVVCLVGFGVAGFLASRGSGEREAVAAELDDLFKLGEIPIGEAGVLPDRPTRRKRKRDRRAASPADHGFGSYEDAMNTPVDMGDATRAGGEARLRGSQVASVMNRHLNRFYRKCVVQEVRSGAKLGTVKVDLAIAGDGKVLGASVRPGSPEFQSCIAREVRSVRFPTFGAPRMGAQYRFSVN